MDCLKKDVQELQTNVGVCTSAFFKLKKNQFMYKTFQSDTLSVWQSSAQTVEVATTSVPPSTPPRRPRLNLDTPMRSAVQALQGDSASPLIAVCCVYIYLYVLSW